MKGKSIIPVVIVICAALVLPSWAARLPEKRETATHVVIGNILSVYVEQQEKPERLLGYVVTIQVDKQEKGTGLKKNDLIHVSCYEMNPRYPPNAPRHPGSQPYEYVPKKGEIVRAFLRHGQGRYSAVFPNWIDVLGKKETR